MNEEGSLVDFPGRGGDIMTDDNDNISQFEPEHLRRWLETTHRYLCADMESLPGAAAETHKRRPPPQTDRHRGRKGFMTRVRDQFSRSAMSAEEDDPLRELAEAWALYRAALTGAFGPERAFLAGRKKP
jgi:hypothetical protein